MREFLARIKAALRRSSALLSEPLSECCVGQARVDFTTRQVLRDGSEESLTRYENDLLRFLALHRGEAVSRARILKEVWGADVPSGSRTVDNCVARLRAKIEPDPSRPRYLLTLHGSGYKLA
jgi:DNA-binding response OmpR family regulator